MEKTNTLSAGHLKHFQINLVILLNQFGLKKKKSLKLILTSPVCFSSSINYEVRLYAMLPSTMNLRVQATAHLLEKIKIKTPSPFSLSYLKTLLIFTDLFAL